MGTKYSTNAASGFDATPPPDDGTVSEANKVKYSTIKSKLATPVKNLADAIDSDLVTHFDVGPTVLTSNTTLGASHYNQIIQVSGSGVTLSLSDAATLGAGWYCRIVNTDTSNSITISRATGGDTINAAASNFTLPANTTIDVFVIAAASGFRVISYVSTDGTQTVSGIKTYSGIQKWSKGADVASANALTLGTDGNYFDITGTTAVTSIGTLGVGTWVKLHFDGALTFTHHATDLILPGGVSITTAAGDEAELVEYATGDWRCVVYTRANGTSVALAPGSIVQEVEAADTTSQSTTSTSFSDTALDVIITPRFSNSIIEVYATIPRISIQAAAGAPTSRQATFKITNSTNSADITGEYLVGRDLIAADAAAAMTRAPLTMIGRYTVNSLTARSFVVRYKSNEATNVNVLLEAHLSTNIILAREIRQ